MLLPHALRASGTGGNFSYVTHGSFYSTSGSVSLAYSIPTSARVGDLALLFRNLDAGDNFNSGGSPGISATLLNSASVSFEIYGRVHAKILAAEDLIGTKTYSGYSSAGHMLIVAIFRNSARSRPFVVGTVNGEATAGNPIPQIVDVATQARPQPIVTFAHVGANNAVNSTLYYSLPGMSVLTNSLTTKHIAAYRFFNPGTALTDFSVDMVDRGQNVLQSGFLYF
jgi:hypothetical protein